MSDVRKVVRKAGVRLALIDFGRVLAVALAGAIGLVIVARLVEQTFGLKAAFAPVWPLVALWGPIAVLAGSVVAALVRRQRAISVAQTLDERADLKEALSTAMYLERERDPWSVAVVESAQRTAKGVDVSRAIPFEAPRLWPAPLGAGMALAIIWFAVPNLDVLGVTEKKVAEVRRVERVEAVKAEIQTREAEIKKMLEKAKVQFVDETGDVNAENQKPEMDDPEAIQRAAVRKLTALTDKLEQEKEGEKAAQAEAIREAMRQLRQPGEGPLDEFSRMLARGDFNKAQDMLKQFEQQLADNSMSPEAQEQAKKQMENLAKQLEKMGKDQQALAKKLEQQGLDKKSAQELAQKAASGNPEDLKKALEQAQNLSDEQKKQLMEMAKAAMQTQAQCQSMSEAMSKAAEGMTQEGLQQEGMEGLEQLAGELSEMEMIQSDMENLDAALDEAKKQLAELAGQCMGGDMPGDGQSGTGQNGSWREGNSQRMGQGSGGPGRGNGASPESSPIDYTTEKVKANTQTTAGPIIGSRLVYGAQVKGESVAEFERVVESSASEAAEALDSQSVPREYHDAVKTYFGRLQERVKKDTGTRPAPATPN
ncbi:MAG: hypothetical protein SFY69_08100 [Planctomycetota bacterium]|nr:hypothetical protein [Planctomycetota bacterium]